MDRDTRRVLRISLAYLLAGVGCALLGAVYEHFSHGVYSFWMAYACLFPLMLGAIPFGAAALRGSRLPGLWARRLWHSGVATLTVGSIIEGVLAIYGTTNRLTAAYWLVGGAMLIVSAAAVVGKKQ